MRLKSSADALTARLGGLASLSVPLGRFDPRTVLLRSIPDAIGAKLDSMSVAAGLLTLNTLRMLPIQLVVGRFGDSSGVFGSLPSVRRCSLSAWRCSRVVFAVSNDSAE